MIILSAPLIIQEGIVNEVFKTSDDIKNDYRYLTNKEFKERKIIKELLIDNNF